MGHLFACTNLNVSWAVVFGKSWLGQMSISAFYGLIDQFLLLYMFVHHHFMFRLCIDTPYVHQNGQQFSIFPESFQTTTNN